jgi:hypothetical protein
VDAHVTTPTAKEATPARARLAYAWRVVAVGAALVGLTGCETKATTSIGVDAGTPQASFSVRFSGDGADAAWEQRDQLEAVFRARGLTGVTTTQEGGDVVVGAGVDVATVVREQALTGVAAVTVEPRADGRVAVAVELVAPGGLAEAITAGVADQEDAAALAEAALGVTQVGARVTLASIEDAAYTTTSGVTVAVEADGGEAGWWFDLAEPQPGVLVVVGTPDGGGVPWWLVAVGLIGAAMVWDWRRRRRDRAVRDAIGW